MPGVKIFKQKDADGRWHEFPEQQFGGSCGVACVQIVKKAATGMTVGDDILRGSMQQKWKGVGAWQDWDKEGAPPEVILAALHAQPAPVKSAVSIESDPLSALRSASPGHPAVVGWEFAIPGDGGGTRIVRHAVVCVGPTHQDPSKFTILDPQFGLQTFDATATVAKGKGFTYKPIGYPYQGFLALDVPPAWQRGFVIATP